MEETFFPINAGNKEEIAKKINSKGGQVIQYGTFHLDKLVNCGGWLFLLDSPKVTKSLANLIIPEDPSRSRECYLTCTDSREDVEKRKFGSRVAFPSYCFLIYPQENLQVPFLCPGGNLYVPQEEPLTPALEAALNSTILTINTHQAANAEREGKKITDLTYENVQEMTKMLLQDIGRAFD